MKASRGLVLGWVLSSLAAVAAAAPIQWSVSSGGNGHYYELVSSASAPLTWADANLAAQTRVFMGVNGYLASISSPAENALS